MRYPVENLLELLSSGMTIDEVLQTIPTLSATTSWPHWSSGRSRPAAAG